MINWVLSIMVHKEIIDLDEAEHLAKELVTMTHPSNFIDAHRIVENLLDKYKRNL